jgi:hypothetical protein
MNLHESNPSISKEHAQRLADAWCKGEDIMGAKIYTPEYFTVMRDRTGKFYATNRFDPRIVEYCKQYNITPRRVC